MTYTDLNKLSNNNKSAGGDAEKRSTSTIVDQQQQQQQQQAAEQNNIWSNILQEVQNSTKKTPPPKSLILLGDNESGRSTLISRLKGVENISKGIGLEYHYIDIKDEDRDDTPKLGVWIPDGDGACTGLLKFALNEANFEHTIVAFVVSMGTPWAIMDSLKKWSNILTEHVKRLNISDEKRNAYLRQLRRSFQLYQEPDESQQLLLGSSNKKSTAAAMAAAAAAATAADENNKNSKEDDDDILVPLDPSILTKNLGISIIVVVTKSDSISILDKENEYRIEHFDFIQYHIRKFCLEYGASLFYTTVKDKRTYDKLYKYLIHKFYGYPFNYPSSVVDRESIFIPSGWDNESKINILLENSTTIKSDSEYTDVISKPSIRKPLQRDVETVQATEDQEFLAKLQIMLNKASTPSMKPDENTQQVMGAAVSSTTAASIKPTNKPTSQSKPNQPDSTNLKNFFQNLLNKNAPAAATTTGANTTAANNMSPVSSTSSISGSNEQQQQVVNIQDRENANIKNESNA